VSFTVADGEFFVVLGPPGSGKSTIMRLLATVLPPDAGSIEVAGHHQGVDDDAIRSSVGFVPQSTLLDPSLTVAENLDLHARFQGMGRMQSANRVAAVMEQLALESKRDRRVDQLTAGERRRADVARALLHQPEVFLIDEPLRGIDIGSADLIWAIVLELRDAGVTVVVATDRADLAEQADMVGILVNGRLVAQGSPTDLIESNCPPTLIMSLVDPQTDVAELAAMGIMAPEPDADGDVVWAVESSAQARDVVSYLGERVLDFDYRHGSLDDVVRLAAGATVVDEPVGVTAPQPAPAPTPSGDGRWVPDGDDFSPDFHRVIAPLTASGADDDASPIPELVPGFGDEVVESEVDVDPTLYDGDLLNWESEDVIEAGEVFAVEGDQTVTVEQAVEPAQAVGPDLNQTDAEMLGFDQGVGPAEAVRLDQTAAEVDMPASVQISGQLDSAVVRPGSTRAADRGEASAPVADTDFDDAATGWLDEPEAAAIDDRFDDAELESDSVEAYEVDDARAQSLARRDGELAPPPPGWGNVSHSEIGLPDHWSRAPRFADTGRTSESRRLAADTDGVEELARLVGSEASSAQTPGSGSTTGSVSRPGSTPTRQPDPIFGSTPGSTSLSGPPQNPQPTSARQPDAIPVSTPSAQNSQPAATPAAAKRNPLRAVGPLARLLARGRTVNPPTPAESTPQAPPEPLAAPTSRPVGQAPVIDLRDDIDPRFDGRAEDQTPYLDADVEPGRDMTGFAARPPVIDLREYDANTVQDDLFDADLSEGRTAGDGLLVDTQMEFDPGEDFDDRRQPVSPFLDSDGLPELGEDADQIGRTVALEQPWPSADLPLDGSDSDRRSGSDRPDSWMDSAAWSADDSVPASSLDESALAGAEPVYEDEYADDTYSDLAMSVDSGALPPVEVDADRTRPVADAVSVSPLDDSWADEDLDLGADPVDEPSPRIGSVLLPPLFTEDVQLDQLASVSHLLQDAILKDALPSFDERFPPGSLPLDRPGLEGSGGEGATGRAKDASSDERRWDAELSRPVDETLAHQARIKLAVEKRISEARRRRAKSQGEDA
jgi:multidrug/hemolysin transport system ATP-binding protein